MNAAAVLGHISMFVLDVLAIEGDRATMASYYTEYMKLNDKLVEMDDDNRFARGILPRIEARMRGDAAAEGRRPAAFDLVATQLTWVFTPEGQKEFAKRMLSAWWETRMPVLDEAERACLYALRCEQEFLEDKFFGARDASWST